MEGEPLLASPEFYRQALPLLSQELQHLNPEFAMQTNLWRMTPEIAQILAEYHVRSVPALTGRKTLLTPSVERDISKRPCMASKSPRFMV